MRSRRFLAVIVISALLASLSFFPISNNTRAASFTITVQGNVFDAAGVPAPIGTDVNITVYDGAAINGVYQAKVLDSSGFYYNDSVSADNGFNISVNATFDSYFDYSNDTVVSGDASYVIHLGQVIYGASIIAPADGAGMSGDTITYMFKITNNGNVKDRYDLSLTSQSGWLASIVGSDQTDILMPGESAFVNVSVTIPVGALADDSDVITLLAESILDPGNIGTATTTTTVLLSAGVVVIPSPAASGKPGEAVTMFFVVKNTGNGPDSYHLTSWVDDAEWLLNMESAADTAIILPGILVFVNITVNVPDYSLFGAYTFVTLKAESNSNPSIYDQKDQLIRTLQNSSVALYNPYSTPSSHPSGMAIASLSLRNTGNGLDSFTLTATAPQGWDYQIVPASISMMAVWEFRNFTMEIDIPSDALIGDALVFTVTATSTYDAAASDTIAFSVEVTSNYAPVAVITSPTDNSEFNTSQLLTFNGTASHDPDNDALDFNWTSSIDGNLGNSSYFTDKLSEGTHTITLTVDDGFGGSDQETVTVTITASDGSGGEDNDDAVTNNTYILLLALVLIALIILFLASKSRKRPEPDGEDLESPENEPADE